MTINMNFFHGLAMDSFADSSSVITVNMKLSVDMKKATRLVVAEAAPTGAELVRLRPESAEQTMEGTLVRGVRLSRAGDLVLISGVSSKPATGELIVRGDLLVDVQAGEVLGLAPSVVRVACFDKTFNVDDTSNARIDFRNLNISRDEARKTRLNISVEVQEGSIHDIREGSRLTHHYSDGFVFKGVVRSSVLKSGRFADLQIEVEETGS